MSASRRLKQAEQALGVAVGRGAEQCHEAEERGRPPFGQPAEAVSWTLRRQGKSSEHGWGYLVSVKIMLRICLKNSLQTTEIQ